MELLSGKTKGVFTLREIDIQNQIRLALSKYGVVIRQNTGNFLTADGRWIHCGVKGLSDLMFIGDGKVAFLEVKTLSGRPTKEQQNFLSRMRQLHHPAGIVRSVEDALKVIGV